eukprot:CAMPEP_0113856062 /NCGR_PEP_ID=MMETSP0372-20130328/8857_1 /TAXON_ID=340204 /ORGANISM="Lankesteria abbotti" /LENGTH=110 /DNA_ID=CAMNT_0000830681 /DNA_START=163 /DNA_END=492 /DNA_ORIENTATION=+ /assembly_acc=CAM_ASM_000359
MTKSVEKCGRIFGVLSNDSDFIVLKNCRMLPFNLFGEDDGVKISERRLDNRGPLVSKLSCRMCDIEDLQQILPFKMEPRTIIDAAILGGCDFTLDYRRQLNPVLGPRRTF